MVWVEEQKQLHRCGMYEWQWDQAHQFEVGHVSCPFCRELAAYSQKVTSTPSAVHHADVDYRLYWRQ